MFMCFQPCCKVEFACIFKFPMPFACSNITILIVQTHCSLLPLQDLNFVTSYCFFHYLCCVAYCQSRITLTLLFLWRHYTFCSPTTSPVWTLPTLRDGCCLFTRSLAGYMVIWITYSRIWQGYVWRCVLPPDFGKLEMLSWFMPPDPP